MIHHLFCFRLSKLASQKSVNSHFPIELNSLFSYKQSSEDAKAGKEFEMKAGFPPKNLLPIVDDTIQSSGLAGDSITVRWKEE